MLYEELPTGLKFLGAVEVIIKFDYKVSIIKIPFLHSSLVSINIYVYIYFICIYIFFRCTIFYLYPLAS